MTMPSSIPTPPTGLAAAYSATAAEWQRGPGRIYDRLAEVIVDRAPTSLVGGRVLDVGAGTGAASRAALAAGVSAVVALDTAMGMASYDAARRPPSVIADARVLPFRAETFDAVVAAFVLNHLTNPSAGFREMARVTRSGGSVLASTYAADDSHPVKDAVQGALRARGWKPDHWYDTLRAKAVPLLATVGGCLEAAGAAGLDAEVEAIAVPFPELDRRDLVAWRLGLAQHAPFLARLAPDDRAAIETDALARLGSSPPPLVRSILVVSAIRV